jgi:GNAT superfamily N-acetyltransferase
VIIDLLDLGDDEAFSEWFRPFHASERFTWPDDPGWAEHELRVLCRDPSEAETLLAVARADDGSPVGCLDVSLPNRESLHVAYVVVAVDPAHRRQGVGRALLEYGERIARDRGRTTAIGRTDDPVQETESPGTLFARAAGYSAGRADARRELRLPVPADRLDELEAASVPFSGGYEIVAWTGACPDHLAAGRVELSRTISADAPRGTLDYDDEDWDLARLRNWEQNVAEINRHLLAAGAVELTSGTLVGFTELGLPIDEPEIAYQFDTVVAPAHRGHRIGTLLKIATTRALAELSPATSRVLTWNAAENDPMIRVNEGLGFELVGLGTGWQKQLA